VNPRLEVALDFLGISFPFEAAGAFITYEDNECKIEAYPQQIDDILTLSEESEKIIGIDQLVKITSFLIGKKLTLGRDKPSIYDLNHRKIIYLRLCLPSGILQLEFQDGEETTDHDGYLSDLISKSWEVN